MNFALFVEGPTERALSAFFKRWLDPQLARPVGVKPVRFRESGDYTKSFAQRARRDLASSQLIGIFGLLDLYGTGLEFPSNASTVSKYTCAKAHLEKQVSDPRFRQYFAVHETEAWLLSDPGIFPDRIRPHLEAFADRPESVNFQEPPAKLLSRMYRTAGREYKKVVDGSALFQKLAPERARERCPHLRALLDDMLSLAKAAGC